MKCSITRNNYEKRTTGKDNEVKMIIMLDPLAKNIKKRLGPLVSHFRASHQAAVQEVLMVH